MNIHYSNEVGSTIHIAGYSLTARKAPPGDGFNIGIQNQEDSSDSAYNSDAFPTTAGDALAVMIEKDGVDLTLRLVNNSTGASNSVSLPGSPNFITTDSIVLSGGGFNGTNHLDTAVESFRIETTD